MVRPWIKTVALAVQSASSFQVSNDATLVYSKTSSETQWQNFRGLCSQIRIPILPNFWHWHLSFYRSHLSLTDSERTHSPLQGSLLGYGGNSQKQHQFRLEAIVLVSPYHLCWLFFVAFGFISISQGVRTLHTTFLQLLCQWFLVSSTKWKGTVGNQKAERREERFSSCLQNAVCHWHWQWLENMNFWVFTQVIWAEAIMAAALAASVVECHWASTTGLWLGWVVGCGSRVVAIVEATVGALGFYSIEELATDFLKNGGSPSISSSSLLASKLLGITLFPFAFWPCGLQMIFTVTNLWIILLSPFIPSYFFKLFGNHFVY